MTKFCSAINCSNRSNRTVNISYHRFPFRNKELLKKWLVKLRRKSFTPTVNSYVCSAHFEADSFLRGYQYKKLKNDALPTIFNFPDHLIKLERRRPSPRKRQAENPQTSSNDDDITLAEVHAEHNYSLPGSPSKLRRKLDTVLKRKDNLILKTNIKIATLRKKSELQEHRISCMQDLISRLKDEKLLCEKTNETLENFSAVQNEIFNRLNGPKNAQYSNLLKSFSLTLHFHSPAAYEFVREKLNLCLPHVNTLRNWVNTVDGNPGFTEEAFIAMKNRINSVPYPVYVAVTFDEMSIKKQIDWDGKQMIGNVNYGPNIDVNTTEAGEALVVMVVALNCWWKIPVGYFLVRGISSDEKACIVRSTLEMLHNVGANCVSLTFDGLAANISMANKLGADLKPTEEIKTWFPHPITGNKVFVLLDACHVFKNIRNLLCEKEVLMDAGGNAIKWSYLKQLEELQKMEGLRLANKLTDRHINYQFQKMKVNLAVQVISRSCATAIKYLSEDLKLPAFIDSAATVEFLIIFDHFFDVCNSRNPFANGTKSAMRENNFETIKSLIDKVEIYALNMRLVDGTFVAKSFRRTVVIGILTLCKSMLGLYEEMIRSKKLSYLLTYKMSQDAVELFFNKIRSRLGWNNNPTAKEFKAAYKRLLIVNEVKSKTTGNCIPREDTPLLSWEGITQKSQVSDENQNQNITLLDELSDHAYGRYSTHLSEFSKNAVVYIAGYVVRSVRSRLQCKDCLNALYATGEINYGDLIKRKNNGGLVVPSQNVVKVCEITERVIRQYSNQVFTAKNVAVTIVNNVLRNTTSCFRELHNHDLQVSEFPSSHLSNLVKEIAKCYLKIKCHHLAMEKSLTVHKKLLRQHLTKSVLFMNQ